MSLAQALHLPYTCLPHASLTPTLTRTLTNATPISTALPLQAREMRQRFLRSFPTLGHYMEQVADLYSISPLHLPTSP